MKSQHLKFVCIIALNLYCDMEVSNDVDLAENDENEEPAPASPTQEFVLTTPPPGPIASTPLTGVVNDAAFITVPSGKVGDWSLMVSPNLMGSEEVGSEKDNAMLRLDCRTTVINEFTWQVTARFKYRFWSTKDGVWKAGKANYILVPRGSL